MPVTHTQLQQLLSAEGAYITMGAFLVWHKDIRDNYSVSVPLRPSLVNLEEAPHLEFGANNGNLWYEYTYR